MRFPSFGRWQLRRDLDGTCLTIFAHESGHGEQLNNGDFFFNLLHLKSLPFLADNTNSSQKNEIQRVEAT